MANEKLKLKQLGVRVEATFEWPGDSEGSTPISMPDAASEIGQRLQGLEERLVPVALGREAPAQIAAAPAETASNEGGGDSDEVANLLKRLERRLDTTDPSRDDVSGLAARLETLERQVERRSPEAELLEAELPETELAEITARLDSLEERSAPSAAMPADLAEMAAQIRALRLQVERPDPSARELASFAVRLRHIEERADESAARTIGLNELASRLRGVEEQIDKAGPASDAMASLLLRLEALEQRPAPQSSTAGLEELSLRLSTLEEQIGMSVAPVEEIVSLAGRVAALEEGQPPLSLSPTEPHDLAERLRGLERRLDGSALASAAQDDALSGRLESQPTPPLAGELSDQSARIDVIEDDRPGASVVASPVAQATYSTLETNAPDGRQRRDGPVVETQQAAAVPHTIGGQGLPARPATTEESPSAAAASEADVLELLRKEIASLHSEFGPLTVAPDAAPTRLTAAQRESDSGTPAGWRFRKGLRHGE